MRSVVITGASTGIGWATAKLLLERGCRLFGSVRKPADADRLRAEFGANFIPLTFALERVRQFLQHLAEIALPPERIGARIADVLTSARPRVRYEITPDPMRHLIAGILPKRMLHRMIARRLGLLPPA